MLSAMAVYVMSDSEALRPGRAPQAAGAGALPDPAIAPGDFAHVGRTRSSAGRPAVSRRAANSTIGRRHAARARDRGPSRLGGHRADGDGGRVCLIRNNRIALGQWLWEIPAGTLDHDEPPLETARRELIEETGYRCEKIEMFGELWMSPGHSQRTDAPVRGHRVDRRPDRLGRGRGNRVARRRPGTKPWR